MYGTGDPLTFVVSANLHRRHLTTQQRAAIAAELATMKRTDTLQRGPEASNDATGKMTDAQAAKPLRAEPSTERAKQRMRTDLEAHAKAKAGTLGRRKPTKRRIPKHKTVDGDPPQAIKPRTS